MENENKQLERQVSKSGYRSKSYERPEKIDTYEVDSSIKRDSLLEQENRELRSKIRRLETELTEKEAELIKLRTHRFSDLSSDKLTEYESMRAAQLQAERLLEAREQSHRQQVLRLESQVF